MSLYSEFLADAKEMIADFGVAGSANSGAITFSCLISDPAVSTVLEAGGYCERTQYTVRLPAVKPGQVPDPGIACAVPIFAAYQESHVQQAS